MQGKPPGRPEVIERLMRGGVRLGAGQVLVGTGITGKAGGMEQLNGEEHHWRYEQADPPEDVSSRSIEQHLPSLGLGLDVPVVAGRCKEILRSAISLATRTTVQLKLCICIT